MPQGLSPSREKAAQGHRDGSDDEGPGRDRKVVAVQVELCRGRRKHQVQKPETEEGNVSKARQPPPVRAVSSHPVLAMKEQADDSAGKHPGQHS